MGKQPLKINAAEPESLEQILPKPLIISSPSLLWNGFYFAYNRQLNLQVSQTCAPQHVIGIGSNNFQAKFNINGQWQRKYYESGDVGIFPANQITPAVEFEQELGFIVLCFEPEFILRAACESVSFDEVEILQQLQTHDPLIQQIGFSVKRELEISVFDSRLYVEYAANMLAIHLLKRYSTQKITIREYAGGLSKQKLQQAIAYINDNLDQNLSLAQMSQVVQMSPHYFATLFKQSMGIAPHQYVTKCRVERAKHLLASSEFSVIQVSQLVGFQSQSHFAKVFRKYVGVSPREFKKAL